MAEHVAITPKPGAVIYAAGGSAGFAPGEILHVPAEHAKALLAAGHAESAASGQQSVETPSEH